MSRWNIAQTIKPNEVNIPKQGLGINDNQTSVDEVLAIVFAVFAAISVIIITIAGLKYVISQGNPQETAKAKDTILYALIGLVVSIFAFAIVRFVVRGIQ